MKLWRARSGCMILAAATVGLVATTFVAAGTARAADDGYANVFSSLFSAVGVIKPDAPPDIAYRERPPLVVPPQPGLPKPSQGIKRSAAWPQDPDVLARRKEDDEARAPRRSTLNDDGKITSAAELAKGRGADEPVRPNACGNNGNSRNCLIVNPDELKRQGEAFAASNPDGKDAIVAGQEPDRVYLTQPPKGYLKATRTVKATSEGPIKKTDEASPYFFMKPGKEAE